MRWNAKQTSPSPASCCSWARRTPPPLSPARGPPQTDLLTGLLAQTPAFDLAEPDPVPDFQFDQSLPDDLEPRGSLVRPASRGSSSHPRPRPSAHLGGPRPAHWPLAARLPQGPARSSPCPPLYTTPPRLALPRPTSPPPAKGLLNFLSVGELPRAFEPRVPGIEPAPRYP